MDWCIKTCGPCVVVLFCFYSSHVQLCASIFDFMKDHYFLIGVFEYKFHYAFELSFWLKYTYKSGNMIDHNIVKFVWSYRWERMFFINHLSRSLSFGSRWKKITFSFSWFWWSVFYCSIPMNNVRYIEYSRKIVR